MADSEHASAQLLGVASGSAKAVAVDLETEDGRVYADVVLTALRVASLPAAEAVTAGAVQSTDFDVGVWDREKNWASPSVTGRLLYLERVLTGLFHVDPVEVHYREVGGRAQLWVYVKHDGSGTADFEVDAWFRPREPPPPDPAARGNARWNPLPPPLFRGGV